MPDSPAPAARRRRRAIQSVVLLLLLSAATLQTRHAGYPASPEVGRHDLAIVVENYASLPVSGGLKGVLSRVSTMRFEPGDAPAFESRMFVADLDRSLYILDIDSRVSTTYINFNQVFGKFSNDGSYGSGLASFVFDPDYVHNGRFYTVHTENPSLPGAAMPSNTSLPGLDLSDGYVTTTSIDPPVGSVLRHAVLIEWTDSNVSNAAFEGTAREVLRIGFNHGSHTVADMIFNPASEPGAADYGNLYIAVGDGSAGQRDDAGHSIPQRLDTLHGKIVRITPDVALRAADVLAANGRYRIPTTGPDANPFAAHGSADMKKEIFAYGFRNPQRLSWDVATNSMIVADIGLHSWEELDIVRKGLITVTPSARASNSCSSEG
jgi:Glucose / Sorbosone dehydrogenase